MIKFNTNMVDVKNTKLKAVKIHLIQTFFITVILN